MKVCIVSTSDKMTLAIKEQLSNFDGMDIQVLNDALLLRKQVLSKDYELIFINYPLPFEKDYHLAYDIRMHSTALVIVFLPTLIYSQKAMQMTRSGIIPVAKPISMTQLKMIVDMNVATYYYLHDTNEKTQRLNARIVDLRYIYRAKCLLIERNGMTEKEAHRLIEKLAMDMRITKREVALKIIHELENQE